MPITALPPTAVRSAPVPPPGGPPVAMANEDPGGQPVATMRATLSGSDAIDGTIYAGTPVAGAFATVDDAIAAARQAATAPVVDDGRISPYTLQQAHGVLAGQDGFEVAPLSFAAAGELPQALAIDGILATPFARIDAEQVLQVERVDATSAALQALVGVGRVISTTRDLAAG